MAPDLPNRRTQIDFSAELFKGPNKRTASSQDSHHPPKADTRVGSLLKGAGLTGKVISTPPEKRNRSGWLAISNTNPYDIYQKRWKLQFGNIEHVTVSLDKTWARGDPGDPSPAVFIHRVSGPEVDKRIQSIQAIRSDHFVAARQIFNFEGIYSVAFEFMPRSLFEIAGNPLLDQAVMAAILSQVLDGLAYLETENLEHGKLTSANILIDFNGTVKLWGQEFCRSRSRPCQDIKALGRVTFELMHGFPKDDGPLGTEDPERWPADSHVVDFLSATTYMSKTAQLAKHKFIQGACDIHKLPEFLSFTTVWTRPDYDFPV